MRRPTHAARSNHPRAHNPAFTAAEFTPTQWASAKDKAKFANALMKFIAHEFPRQSFTRSLYQRLSNTFGHIAHTNVDGFYGAFFERDFDKVVFLEQTLSWPHFGDPTFTFSDVERAVKRRLRAAQGDRHLPFARGRRHSTGASSRRSLACRRNTESEHRRPIWRPLAHKFPPDEPTTPTLSVTS